MHVLMTITGAVVLGLGVYGEPPGPDPLLGDSVRILVMADRGAPERLMVELREAMDEVLGTMGPWTITTTSEGPNRGQPAQADVVVVVRRTGAAAADPIEIAKGVPIVHVEAFPMPAGERIAEGMGALADMAGVRSLAVVAPPELEEEVVLGYRSSAGPSWDSAPVLVRATQPVSAVVDSVVASGANGAYVFPLPTWSRAEREELAVALRHRGVATFAAGGIGDVELGFLATFQEDQNRRIARQAALRIVHALEPRGKSLDTGQPGDSAQLPDVSFSPSRPSLLVNRETASRLSIELRMRDRLDVRWFVPLDHRSEEIPFEKIIREATSNSPGFRASAARRAAEREEVTHARARVLPRMELGTRGRLVDEDAAAASFGNEPERTFEASLSIRQVLFSEPAFAAHAIQQELDAARRWEGERDRLDVGLAAAEAATHVLRTRGEVRARQEHLDLARAHLAGARLRQDAGLVTSADVSRLAGEVARARQGLTQALAGERQAELKLNRAMGRRLEDPGPLPPAIDPDLESLRSASRYGEVLDGPDRYERLRDFWITEALASSPEIAAAASGVDARARSVRSASRSRWLPEVALVASASARLAEGGAGVGSPLPGDAPFSLPVPPDRRWSLGVAMSLPLLEGGSRTARESETQAELRAAEFAVEEAKLRAEERVRTALQLLAARHLSVEDAFAAHRAARRSFHAVEDAYRQGTGTVLDLLEALRSLRVAREEAHGAVLDQLTAELRLERAAGLLRGVRPENDALDLEERLRRHFDFPSSGEEDG